MAHYHVFIPGLFSSLALWRKDFGFEPHSPVLMRLLANPARQRIPVKGLERSLLHWLGADVEHHVPWAALRHELESGNMYQSPLLCADPVYLHSGVDRVVLHPEAPGLDREETELLFADLNRHLQQDGLVLKAFSPQRWYLHQLDDTFITPLPVTTPPSEVGGDSIFPSLPRSDERYWHRLMNEIQMLLHDHPVNQMREQNGQVPVKGIWLWGEGDLDKATQVAVVSVQGGGHVGQVVAGLARCTWLEEVQITAQQGDNGDHLVIIDDLRVQAMLDQPEQWQQTLTGMNGVFEQLLEGLNSGARVTVYDAEGHGWLCQKTAGWMFWRVKQGEWGWFV